MKKYSTELSVRIHLLHDHYRPRDITSEELIAGLEERLALFKQYPETARVSRSKDEFRSHGTINTGDPVVVELEDTGINTGVAADFNTTQFHLQFYCEDMQYFYRKVVPGCQSLPPLQRYSDMTFTSEVATGNEQVDSAILAVETQVTDSRFEYPDMIQHYTVVLAPDYCIVDFCERCSDEAGEDIKHPKFGVVDIAGLAELQTDLAACGFKLMHQQAAEEPAHQQHPGQ